MGSPYQSGRIAYEYGLSGPCHGIDTACSSSLVATHAARTAINASECQAAVVGGVNAMLWSGTTVGICQLGALSRAGRCQNLEAAADGYGRGEGFAIAVLVSEQGLGAGERDDGWLLCVLSGSAVNQDGRSSSLTAPNGPAQTSLINVALESALIAANQVSFIGLHGTGTALGDPLEVGALSSALSGSGSDPLMLTAVKSCYGHTEGAAGMKE